ncbi:ABC transporter permease [Microbacterium sp. STN6]|uniref:ABC transporter permease n=1 Tax=Microbacterium sp. STN6 TaxID=2995588 RepID=UPI002260DD18|nr:ABC transporter permease [Microbacterium sp. STN6]MCX7520946.1 ABC transporter permease [Microbacterium sp. STN6]
MTTVRARRFGAWYVAEHRLLVMRSYLQTIVISGLGNPLLYLYAMGVGLGSLVSSNMGAGAVDGVSYLTFVAPALLCSAALTTASEEFTYPVMLGFKWNPTFFGMNAAPISPGQIIDGLIIATTARVVVTSAVYYGFMQLFGAVPSAWGFATIVVATLTALAFGIPVMTYVATIEQDTGQIAMLMRFVLLPMTLFSGTFFPLTAMPVFLQWIGWISPLWHGVQLARVFAYGASEPAWLTVVHVVYMLALVTVCWAWSRRIAARRLNK